MRIGYFWREERKGVESVNNSKESEKGCVHVCVRVVVGTKGKRDEGLGMFTRVIDSRGGREGAVLGAVFIPLPLSPPARDCG